MEGGHKHPLLAASSLPFPPFTSPKVAHKGHLSSAASAPPLSPPGCPPHQSIPCQENERTAVLNGTLCVHWRAGARTPLRDKSECQQHPWQNHAGPPITSPSSLFSRSFILRRCPELQSATLSPRLQRQQKPSKPSSAAQVTDPEMTTPYRARNASTHIHTHSKTLLPSSPLTHTPSTPPHSPTSLPPPTCQTLLDIQKRKQETCCLPGKCCLHIIRF